jgi:hypothetical protein
MAKIKMIKNDAVVQIGIGAGFMQKIQTMLMNITSKLSMDDIKTYKELVDNSQPFTETWMEDVTILTTLLKELEDKANEQGLIFEEDVPDDSPIVKS